MPDESAAGLLIPTAKTRATDFSIAAIMARGAGPPESCSENSPERNSTGLSFSKNHHNKKRNNCKFFFRIKKRILRVTF